MAPQREQLNHPERIHEFVHLLVEKAIPRITDPLPEAFAQLLNELDEMPLSNKPRQIANPMAFIRLSIILYRNNNPTMGELSQALAVPLPTVTRVVEWFVDSGYAQRLSDASDRRIVRVSHTDKGRRLHEAISSLLAQSLQKIIGCLTEEEQITLLTLVRKLAAASAKNIEHDGNS